MIINDGYTQIWAITYNNGQFWFNTHYTTYPFCAGSAGLKLYSENGVLYFDVQSAIEYVQKPWNGQLSKETTLHELKDYMSGYSPDAPNIPIQPNIQLKLESHHD